MNDSDYNPQLEPWYSPKVIIDYFELLRRQYGGAVQMDPLFKTAREMFSAAVSLFGAYELSEENKCYLQKNNQSASPDVMAAMMVKGLDGHNTLAMQMMELVSMEEHAGTDDIVQFLQKTKLSNRKAYSKFMMIVLFVNRIMSVDYKDIHKRLIALRPKGTIYICGKPIESDMGEFMMFQVNPNLTTPLRFNINKTVRKYSLHSSITFSLGSKDIEIPTGQRDVDIFVVLGLNRERIRRKFGIVPLQPLR